MRDNPHVVECESEEIRVLFDDLRGRFAPTMASLRLDADEHRIVPMVLFLECCHVLERVSRHDAVIMVSRDRERRRVFRSIPDSMKRGSMTTDS